jgi:hypothetical protein
MPYVTEDNITHVVLERRLCWTRHWVDYGRNILQGERQPHSKR